MLFSMEHIFQHVSVRLTRDFMAIYLNWVGLAYMQVGTQGRTFYEK